MKHIDEHYKDWCGEHHTVNSCHPVHDSAATCDFAEYYAKELLSWIDVDEKLPMAYESGNWDELRSDFVLAKNKHGNVFIARTYQGAMDGHEFCDFVCKDDVVLSHIVSWRKIEPLA
jgi:hypothetical protein